MGCLEGSDVPVLYIGCTVPKGLCKDNGKQRFSTITDTYVFHYRAANSMTVNMTVKWQSFSDFTSSTRNLCAFCKAILFFNKLFMFLSIGALLYQYIE
jgi:hypothetical protein